MADNYVNNYQKINNTLICSPEEIALNLKLISESEFLNNINNFKNSDYYQNLKKILLNKKSFSLVIPCFNSENSINELIDNIFSEVDDFIEFDLAEIICVDDCSKDGTKILLKIYKTKEIKFYIYQTIKTLVK